MADRIYNVGNIIENIASNSIAVIVAIMRNHNGLHLKTVNLVNGDIGHLNDVDSKVSNGNLSILHYSIDGYLARHSVDDWIEVKIEKMISIGYWELNH